jgi:hypothetical protein
MTFGHFSSQSTEVCQRNPGRTRNSSYAREQHIGIEHHPYRRHGGSRLVCGCVYRRAFKRDGGLDFGRAARLGHIRETSLDAMAESVEAGLHAANALEQARIDQRGNWLAIFVDDDAVVPVLHAIDHFAQVLPEVDRAGFGNHGDLISMTMAISMG